MGRVALDAAETGIAVALDETGHVGQYLLMLGPDAPLPGGPCVERLDSRAHGLSLMPARQPVFSGQLAGQSYQRQHLGGPALQRAGRGEAVYLGEAVHLAGQIALL